MNRARPVLYHFKLLNSSKEMR